MKWYNKESYLLPLLHITSIRLDWAAFSLSNESFSVIVIYFILGGTQPGLPLSY